MIAIPSATATNVTATTQIYKKPAHIVGFYVNSTTAGTIVFTDTDTGASITLSGTITPAVGWHDFPADCANGILVTIGAALNVTVFWTPV